MKMSIVVTNTCCGDTPTMSMDKTVLVIGAGAREHALAWKLSQSKHTNRIIVTPGNAGTDTLPKVENNTDVNIKDNSCIVDYCKEQKVDLVVVGPEDPLANGLVDALTEEKMPCFGPTKEAALIESSKAFSKEFMVRHGIPTARFKTFNCPDMAKKHIMSASYPALVVKASGLAAGKGVIVANSKEEACKVAEIMLTDRHFGEAGAEIVVEEKLEGLEISTHCFTDGFLFHIMPYAQDHKRLEEGDRGPNTGGMGAFAPYPLVDTDVIEIIRKDIFQKTIDGLRNENRMFVGVLYPGIMLTADGPKVLEYNCRFGDPETEVLLPLLKDDLFEIMRDCVSHRLDLWPKPIAWRTDVVACGISLVSQGYPNAYNKGIAIQGLKSKPEYSPDADRLLFHAGTRRDARSAVVTNGGRVLNVVGIGATLALAKGRALAQVGEVYFQGMQYRKDIGLHVLGKPLTYASAGVKIQEGNKLVESIKGVCAASRRPGADKTIGGFGAVFDLADSGYEGKVRLVLGTDGVGTKLKVAQRCGRVDTVGVDLVAMCANDVLCQGAEPLAFLDYYATGKLDAKHAAHVIEGIARGCKLAGCALVGGETAEMPGFYEKGEFDLAGFVVGALGQDDPLLPQIENIKENDIVLGLPSTGIHSNGFSLVRKILDLSKLEWFSEEEKCPFHPAKSFPEALLEPTRIYVKPLLPLIRQGLIKGVAHITGGGLIENIPRILPDGTGVSLDCTNWILPKVFEWLQDIGSVEEEEMLKTFNCGLGMVLIVSPDDAHTVQNRLLTTGERVFKVGTVRNVSQGENRVEIKNWRMPTRVCEANQWEANGIVNGIAQKKRVGVLISGSGTNLQALIDHTESRHSDCEISVVISNVPDVKGLERAQNHRIPTEVVPHKDFATREAFEARIDEILRTHRVDLVCMAGFMRILTAFFVEKWRGRLLNVHPSLLPAFKGANAHRDVLRSGARLSGCTVHFVEVDVDSGGIVEQESVRVSPDETEDSLSEKIKKIEHKIFPKAMEMVATGRVRLGSGNAVIRRSEKL